MLSWCENLEDEALNQAKNLAAHPVTAHHVALMPDAHVGYGMPIGGVIACRDALIPNAVGVDIGCGMVAVKTQLDEKSLGGPQAIRSILDDIKKRIPMKEGRSHNTPQPWEGFKKFYDSFKTQPPPWAPENKQTHDKKNLGTLGGGNHFIELQASEEGYVWLMIHSGSRNLGHRIAQHYHARAQELNRSEGITLPHEDLAFLPAQSEDGKGYIRAMNFALSYALENRRVMMEHFKEVLIKHCPSTQILDEINIHHNYAALEEHFGEKLWVHRKGATSAKEGEWGIIPGSMGTSSYIVQGKGHQDSLMSCSHGAGRKMGRMQACRKLNLEECTQAMEGIVHDSWKTNKYRKKNAGQFDLSEAPLAYKNIDEVIEAELDLIEPKVKLRPLGVLKG
ncbi:MAG: RtcB family protein [Planctomycetes bacterium]|nr:RtcB family protein [Planctomycetota bacterium]